MTQNLFTIQLHKLISIIRNVLANEKSWLDNFLKPIGNSFIKIVTVRIFFISVLKVFKNLLCGLSAFGKQTAHYPRPMAEIKEGNP